MVRYSRHKRDEVITGRLNLKKVKSQWKLDENLLFWGNSDHSARDQAAHSLLISEETDSDIFYLKLTLVSQEFYF